MVRARAWGNEHRQPKGHGRSFGFVRFSSVSKPCTCTTRPVLIPPTQLAACAKVVLRPGVHPISPHVAASSWWLPTRGRAAPQERAPCSKKRKGLSRNPLHRESDSTIHCSHARQDRAQPLVGLAQARRLAQMALATLGRLGRRWVCGHCGR